MRSIAERYKGDCEDSEAEIQLCLRFEVLAGSILCHLWVGYFKLEVVFLTFCLHLK